MLTARSDLMFTENYKFGLNRAVHQMEGLRQFSKFLTVDIELFFSTEIIWFGQAFLFKQ
jgi:hypothetical protein